MQSVFIDPQTLQIVGTGVQVDYDPYLIDPETANIILNEGIITLVSDPIKVFEKAMKLVRKQRDVLLTECDWTQLSDAPLQNKAEWAVYRQTLRDLPANTTDPENVIWPTPPRVK